MAAHRESPPCHVAKPTRVARRRRPERRSFRITRIGLVFQEFELLEYLSVLDNILLPYRINPSLQLEKPVRERAEGLAEQMGIADQLRMPLPRGGV